MWGWDLRPPAQLCTWFSVPEGTLSPTAAMYVLPMVLIFSTLLNLGFRSSCGTRGHSHVAQLQPGPTPGSEKGWGPSRPCC